MGGIMANVRYGRDFSVKEYIALDPIEVTQVISDQTQLNLKLVGLLGDLDIQAKLIGDKEWTTLYSGTGTDFEKIDIADYDELRLISADNLSTGKIIFSTFRLSYTSIDSIATGGGGDATAANQAVANDLLNQILQDNDFSKTPVVTNLPVSAIGTIYNVVLPMNTRKFIIRHRDKGNIEFSFESNLSSYFTVNKGCSFSEQDLYLTGENLYLRSDKTGTIEIITWT